MASFSMSVAICSWHIACLIHGDDTHEIAVGIWSSLVHWLGCLYLISEDVAWVLAPFLLPDSCSWRFWEAAVMAPVVCACDPCGRLEFLAPGFHAGPVSACAGIYGEWTGGQRQGSSLCISLFLSQCLLNWSKRKSNLEAWFLYICVCLHSHVYCILSDFKSNRNFQLSLNWIPPMTQPHLESWYFGTIKRLISRNTEEPLRKKLIPRERTEEMLTTVVYG